MAVYGAQIKLALGRGLEDSRHRLLIPHKLAGSPNSVRLTDKAVISFHPGR